eukprot:2286371-Amphidinium_carterae.1
MRSHGMPESVIGDDIFALHTLRLGPVQDCTLLKAAALAVVPARSTMEITHSGGVQITTETPANKRLHHRSNLKPGDAQE